MIIYFADREMRVLGHASTTLRKGYVVTEDIKTEEIETGMTTFSCCIGYDKGKRAELTAMTNAGNYLLRSHGDENEFFTILESEIDTKNQTIYVYAEGAGLDLINEIAPPFDSGTDYYAPWYINKYIEGSGFEIGINEIPDNVERKLSWEGESTVAQRIASIAKQFGDYEISFSYAIKGLEITNKYINFHARRGMDLGVTLRLNKEIDRIITSKSVANLATAFVCEGGADDAGNPMTFSSKGFTYDDGDFFIDGDTLKSRKANEKWKRYVWNDAPKKQHDDVVGYIERPYSYDTDDPQTLCSHAITELKKVCDMEVNYEIDITRLPEGVKLGDRINIVDDEGELYASSRLLMLETSVADLKHAATLGEHIIKTSGISQKVIELAEKLAKEAKSSARALMVANQAKKAADAAQIQANQAASGAANAQAAADQANANAANAQAKADEAATAAGNALESASAAQEDASKAQAAVNVVENSVESLQTTVTEAKAAAENANKAAEEATAKADEAATAATNASEDAAEAKTKSEAAQTSAESAITKAEDAITTAEEAKTQADQAQTTAQSAKADAEQAKADLGAFAETLTTLSTTMEAYYARKTELTETTASLQSQITQNAGKLESTVKQVTVIDETANNAKEQAEAAQATASAAQSKADQATADAQAAQTAADNAAAAATSAQTEADKAKTAAEAAQSVADKAEADLEQAKSDLATVSGRVDATEEEIAAAQQAVTTAQAKADEAKADAATATQKANDAQTTANTAVTNASNAQQAADNAAQQAEVAQLLAQEAEGNATAAQAKANEAAEAAANAQETANTAVANAEAAQAKANQAVADAEKAQQAADAADAKVVQAQTDLNTAKQNLEDVTSRVGATEEEVAAAQQAVVAAQNAANTAKAEAEAAQATADQAKDNATTAQTAADNAQTAADNAQKAAADAKKAADDAQDAANALAVRVETAETEITQTKEQIKLLATKEEVTQTLGGYYTKAQSDSVLNVKADAIMASVTNKINAIEIGARNLIQFGDLSFVSCQVDGASTNNLSVSGVSVYGNSVIKINRTFGAGTYVINATGSVGGKSFRLLVSKKLSNAFTGPNSYYESLGLAYYSYATTFPMVVTFTEETMIGIVMLADVGSQTITGLKFEKGSNPTDWTPAPEDVEKAIDDTEEDLKKEITDKETSILQSAESITMTALESYVDSKSFEDYKAELSIKHDEIDMSFQSANEKMDDVATDLQEEVERRSKRITFSENGISITSGDGSGTVLSLELDNGMISFKKNGQQFGWWDGVDFHTGNIVVNVNERAQFGNFAFVPRSDGSLMFLKVGDK